MFRPKAGEIKILNQRFGRILFEQSFTGRDGTIDVFGPLFDSANKPPTVILPLTHDNKVVAIRQFRYGANKFILEIPGGNPKTGESIKKCLAAELEEETGYQSKQIVIFNNRPWFEPSSTRVYFIPVLALNCRKIKKPKLERTEIIKTMEIPIKKWFEMIKAGEIEDSKTLAVTALAWLHLYGAPTD